MANAKQPKTIPTIAEPCFSDLIPMTPRMIAAIEPIGPVMHAGYANAAIPQTSAAMAHLAFVDNGGFLLVGSVDILN